MKRCVVSGVFLLAVAVLLIGLQRVGQAAPPLPEIRQVLRQSALKPPAESALEGLRQHNLGEALRQIDPYARWYAADEYSSPESGGPDTWIGIGADLQERAEEIYLAVYAGGAADQAGLPDRCRLLAIDGESIAGLSMAAVAERLKGGEGGFVSLEVAQPDGHPGHFQIKRRAFTSLNVELVRAGGYRVLRIREFIAGLTRAALMASIPFTGNRGASAQNTEGLIIDLRDAGGGDLYEAFDVAGLFLPAGTILGSLQQRGGTPRLMQAPAGEIFTMPLVLLIGADTASAAEVFAGTLQQHGRARLIGRQTYGKCSSQTDIRLSDGSVLRYTNGEIFLPDGTSCSGLGLQPDREVTEAVFRDLNQLVFAAEAMFETNGQGPRPSAAFYP